MTAVSGGQNDAPGSPSIYGTTVATMLPYGPQTVTYGNNLVNTLQYDAVGRLHGGWLCGAPGGYNCPNGSVYHFGFYMNQSGNQIQSSTETVSGRWNAYNYDDMGRLTGTAPVPPYSDIGMSATYDRYGNRWSQLISNSGGTSPNTSFPTNVANNQISLSGFLYDGVGNLMNDGIHTYQYDAENNLISVDNGSTAVYAYDAFNVRAKASTGGVTDRYGQDLAGRRATTWLDGSTALKLAQYYGDSGPVAFWSAGDGHIHFQHGDWLGTVRKTTSNIGAEEGILNTMPFGELVAASGNDPSPSHFAMLDQDLTAAAGLSHAMFREYSSIQGRWMSPDPYAGSYDVSDPQSLNRYSYVESSPLSSTDPLGLCSAIEGTGRIRGLRPQPRCGSGLNPVQPPVTGTGTTDDPFTLTLTPVICGMGCTDQDPTTTGPGENDPGSGSHSSGSPGGSLAALTIQRTLDPDNQECKALANRILNIIADIKSSQGDLATNPMNLPLYAPPGTPRRAYVQGHRELLDEKMQNLANRAHEYNQKCGGGDPFGGAAPSTSPSPVRSGGMRRGAVILGGVIVVGGTAILCPECLLFPVAALLGGS